MEICFIQPERKILADKNSIIKHAVIEYYTI